MNSELNWHDKIEARDRARNAVEVAKQTRIQKLAAALTQADPFCLEFHKLGIAPEYAGEARGYMVTCGWRAIAPGVWQWKPTVESVAVLSRDLHRERGIRAEDARCLRAEEAIESRAWPRFLPKLGQYLADKDEAYFDEICAAVGSPGDTPRRVFVPLSYALHSLGWESVGRRMVYGKRRQLWRSVLV